MKTYPNQNPNRSVMGNLLVFAYTTLGLLAMAMITSSHAHDRELGVFACLLAVMLLVIESALERHRECKYNWEKSRQSKLQRSFNRARMNHSMNYTRKQP